VLWGSFVSAAVPSKCVQCLPPPSAPDRRAGVLSADITFSKVVNSRVIQFSMLHVVLMTDD
jgi:hypothetical protein